MGIFDKIFGKKSNTDFSKQETETVYLQKGDTIISTGDKTGFGCEVVTKLILLFYRLKKSFYLKNKKKQLCEKNLFYL